MTGAALADGTALGTGALAEAIAVEAAPEDAACVAEELGVALAVVAVRTSGALPTGVAVVVATAAKVPVGADVGVAIVVGAAEVVLEVEGGVLPVGVSLEQPASAPRPHATHTTCLMKSTMLL